MLQGGEKSLTTSTLNIKLHYDSVLTHFDYLKYITYILIISNTYIHFDNVKYIILSTLDLFFLKFSKVNHMYIYQILSLH